MTKAGINRSVGIYDRRAWIAFVLIMLLALGLRFYRIDAQSIWNDEGTSIALAQRDLPTITRNASHDIHPPLYYYLLHLWVKWAGTSEFSARSLSALAGLVLVAGTYLLARRTFSPVLGTDGPTTAILASLFAAISPFQVYYAQEARMYILVTLFGLCAMLAYKRYLAGYGQVDDGEGWARRGALYILASVLAIYSHYFAFSLLLAQNIGFAVWLIRQAHRRPQKAFPWRLLLHWGAIQALILLFYTPWLAVSWRSLKAWPAVSASLSLGDLLSKIAQVLPLGITVGEGTTTRLIGLFLSLLVLPGMFWPGPARGDQPGTLRRPSGRLITALYLLVPIGVLYASSLSRPMYKPKFVLLVTPAYHILQAYGIVALGHGVKQMIKASWARAAITLTLTVMVCAASGYSLFNLYTDETYFRDDYRGIINYIDATGNSEDAILINAPSQIETVDYYYHGPLPEYPLPKQRPINTDQTREDLEQLVAQHPRIYAILWATDESDPQGFIEGWLDQHTFKAMDSWFGNVRLVVYAAPRAAANEARGAHPLDYMLGDEIRLRGYTLLTPEPHSGEIVQLTLFWEALGPIDARYKVFAHILDDQGHIVGQRDSEPGGGSRPTTNWKADEVIPDNYGVPIQPGTPPGTYTLRIGLYSLADGQRLPIAVKDKAVGDAIDLTDFVMQPAQAPLPIAALDIDRPDDVSWGALQLIGHSLCRLGLEHQPDAPLRPGDVAKLALFWRRGDGEPAQEGFILALTDRSGRHVWEQPLRVSGGTISLTAWREGEIMRNLYHLALPQTLPPGSYRLILRPDGWGQDREYMLDRVSIQP